MRQTLLLLVEAAVVVSLGNPHKGPLVSVSPSRDLGFVVLFASEDERRLVPVSVSKRDKERVVSAEAMTLLQLLHGIDTATGILPPDALFRAFSSGENDSPILQAGPSLRAVRVATRRDAESEAVEPEPSPQCDAVTAARRAPVLRAAVAKLGLEASEEEAAALLRRYSVDGELSRDGFKAVLGELRDERTPTEAAVETRLVAFDGTEVAARPFEAICLALRYKSPIEIDDALFDSALAIDADDATTRFPLLTTVRDLQIEALRLEAQSRDLSSQAASLVANAFGPRSAFDDHDRDDSS